jgi:excisionase family DNA binding protein
MTQMALTVNEACATARMGRTKLYEAINSGALPAKKHGKRTLILTADLHRWLDALPNVKTRGPAAAIATLGRDEERMA